MAGLTMKYFVLVPKGKDLDARAARAAIRTFAGVIREKNPEKADDLEEWVGKLEEQAAKDDEEKAD